MDVQKDAKDALIISYEAGGIVVKKPFAPWCAEWITVEARLSGQAEVAQASDFVLSVSDFGDVACQQFSPGEGGVHLARFRLAPTGKDISCVVKFRGKALHSRPNMIPFLDRSAYLRQLNLLFPTVSCQFHGETVACKTYVSSQARNLVATCGPEPDKMESCRHVLQIPATAQPLPMWRQVYNLPNAVSSCARQDGILSTDLALTRRELAGHVLFVAAFKRRRSP